MLDWIYSNFFYFFIFYLILGGFIFARILIIYKSAWAYFTSFIVFLAIMVGIIFFGIHSRSGYLSYKNIAYLGTHQKYLLIKDKVHFIGRGGEGEPRFYWVDMENGQVLFRKGIDRTNTSLLSYSEKFMYYKTKDEICVVDIETGDLVEFSEDQVATLLSNDYEGLNRYTFDLKN